MEMQLLERMSVSGRVDRVSSIVHGVKILGLESRNGRRYPASAIREAAHLYEGARVNFDHPKSNPSGARNYSDRFGTLQAIEARASGLYGDLKFNPKHPLAEQFLYDAENNPGALGLSHNVDATSRREGGTTIIESIKRVHSVDLVSDPATTNGLFESLSEPVDSRTYAEKLRDPDGVSPERIRAVVARYTGRWPKSRVASSVTAQAAYRSRDPAETAAKYHAL